MQFSTASIVAFAAFLGFSNAWTVTLFPDQDFSGGAYKVSGQRNVCANVPGSINDKTSSVQGDLALQCNYFQDGGCTGPIILHTGVHENKGTVPVNDAISSVKCY